MSPEEEEEAVHREEIQALHREYDWVLKHEVHNVLRELTSVLAECVRRFPMPLAGIDKHVEADKFVLSTPSTSPADQLKVVVTLSGDCVSHADINLKLPRPGTSKDLYHNTSVREDAPWRLQQVQDAGNHLQMAVTELGGLDHDCEFRNAAEVDSFLDRIQSCLQRSRNALVNPKKRTLEELHSSKQVKSLQPPLPPELALSFYVQGWKLVFGVYHIVTEKGAPSFKRYQAESAIPWANEVLTLLTVGMQTAQQLRDKVNVFSQYQDMLEVPAAAASASE